ncbi:MAG: DUF63 family protein, partial [Euryarchaeota archaeon]|nr:DUF63 family protein [Euryarchaeota archaeon]
MGVLEFLVEHFIQPLRTGEGYNLVNTLTYGILLLLFAFLVLRWLRSSGVRLSTELLFALTPFTILAGVLRALEEFARVTGAGVLPHSYLFLTPGIYFLTAALALLSMSIARRLSQNWEAAMLRLGMLMLLPVLAIYLHDLYLVSTGTVLSSGEAVSLNPWAMLRILLLSVLFAGAAGALLHLLRLSSRENLLILYGAALDSASVYVAFSMLGYSVEQPLTHAMLGM